MKLIDDLITAFKGPAQARAAHRQALLRQPSVARGVEILRAHTQADEDDTESPIFLLSAGWRSGSTMLQRLIMSDSRVLIWGEPYDECGTIQALAAGMKAFREGWPPSDYFYDGSAPQDLSGEWIANLFPGLQDLRRAHRAFFDTLFAEPARRAGAERWGIKEVRLTAEHAHYLKWLYPKARFLLLYRNPLEAYRSYARYGRSWYDVFPDRPVFTPSHFGAHWSELMRGYLQEAEHLDALLVRYEDLIGKQPPLEALNAYLCTEVDRSVLTNKVGSSELGGAKVVINALERSLLRRHVKTISDQLGYVL
ncbi:sulfotransferase [Thauera sp. WH-1]|uniref:sulfotransferase n=1 Tax=Thauera sp. WH-1 TaxID=3398230 RepID=UPI0039FC22A5